MGFVDYIVLGVILAVLCGCALYIRHNKKKGRACVGCPSGCACSAGNCTGGCNGCGGKK